MFRNYFTIIDKKSFEGNGKDGVHVVWQRKKANGKYEIWYRKSSDTGVTWQDAVQLENDVSCSYYQSAGPMPVITSITSASTYKLMVVWVSSSGLKWKLYDTTWGNTQSLDDGSYNDNVWFPSLMGKGNFASLTYDTRFWGVYSRTFNGSSWSSRTEVSSGTGTIYDRSSQVAIDVSGNPIATWCAQDASAFRIVFRSGYADNT